MSDMPRLIPPDMDGRLDDALVNIPAHCREGLANYIRYGVPPGHFLLAVLTNDLAGACARADEDNKYKLFNYVYVLTNYAPIACWGGVESVKYWIAKGAALRRGEAVQP